MTCVWSCLPCSIWFQTNSWTFVNPTRSSLYQIALFIFWSKQFMVSLCKFQKREWWYFTVFLAETPLQLCLSKNTHNLPLALPSRLIIPLIIPSSLLKSNEILKKVLTSANTGLKDRLAQGQFNLFWAHSKQNQSYSLTKQLTPAHHQILCSLTSSCKQTWSNLFHSMLAQKSTCSRQLTIQ